MGTAVCQLCRAAVATSRIGFVHRRGRPGELITLDLPLCEACGDRIEKHLKRAIPKRLMTVTVLPEPPSGGWGG